MTIMGSTAVAFSEEQAMLMDVAREFCRDKSPIAEVREQLETETGFDASLWQEMVDLGWAGISLPESVGGSGLSLAALVPVVEAMGRAMLGTPLINASLAGQLILRAGNTEQTERLLPDLATGAIATVALLDNADWGADGLGLALDDNGMLSGTKRLVGDAAVAELLVVAASRGGTAVLAVVRAEQLAEGSLRPCTLVDQTKRAADIDFTGIKVDPNNIIAGPKVSGALRDIRLLGALLVAAEATGSSYACLSTIVEYLNNRKQFGKLIGSYQALKHPTVEILTSADSSRSFIYHAATLVGEGELGRDAEIACRMAKAQSSETIAFAGDRAVQFHGGMGFTYECDAQLYIRRAQWTRQAYGDAQHHRKHLAALWLD